MGEKGYGVYKIGFGNLYWKSTSSPLSTSQTVSINPNYYYYENLVLPTGCLAMRPIVLGSILQKQKRRLSNGYAQQYRIFR